MTRVCIVHHVILAVVAICFVTPNHRGNAQDRNLVHVEHADSLVGSSIDGVDYRELIGGVRIRQDNVRISCQRALQNLDANEVELIGDVVITQDTLVVKTRRGMYNGNERVAWSSSGIFLHDGHTTLTAESGRYETRPKRARFSSRVTVDEPDAFIRSSNLVYERDSAKAVATGEVRVRFKGENVLVTGDSVVHYIDRKFTMFTASPSLWQIDTTVVRRDSVTMHPDSIRLDTTHITARRMEARRDSVNRFTATGDVAMLRGDLAARCGETEYRRSDSMLVLRYAPIAWYEQSQITGDSIALFLADGTLRRMSVIRNAFSLSQSKPSDTASVWPEGRFDQTKGKNIHLTFVDENPDSIRVEETAVSLYYLFDGNALNGVRRESGDLIIIRFVDGEAETIHTIGGVEGTYFPEKFVTGKEETYNLEGFMLRDDKPAREAYPAIE